jgi:putative hydroxymethylpyrimidine transport system substrate-binding protein
MMHSFVRLSLLLAALTVCRPAAAADKLSVLLDWFVNPNHGPLIVAQEIGAYQRAGLEVDFIQPADPTMPPRLVAAGHGDIAIDYQPQLYQQVVNGLPLMRIGVLVDKSLETLVTLEGDGVTSIADLKGKRIGYNEVGGAVNLAEISRILATGNLAMNDVTLINVGTALSTSLLTHRVDAVGVDRNFEAFELIDKGAKPIGFDYDKFGVPQFDDLIMVVNKDTVRDPRYPRFLAAVKEGAAYIATHPEEAWKLFIHAYPDLDNKLNHDAWLFTVPYFAADPAALDTDKYIRFGEFLVSQKVIEVAPPLASYAVELK